MPEIRIEKRLLDYIPDDFGNLIFQILEEDDTHITFHFNKEDLIVHNDIKADPNYKSNQNNHSLVQKLAQSKHNYIISKIASKVSDPTLKDEIYFIFLYIKAGIDCTPDTLMLNNIHTQNISKLFKSKIISRKNIDNVEIVIRYKNRKGNEEVIFNNLYWSHPLFHNILLSIADTFPSTKIGTPLRSLFDACDTSSAKLESIAREYDKNYNDFRQYSVLKAADSIIKHFNNYRILTGRGLLGTKTQLELIYDIFEVLNLVKPKADVDGDHIKRFRERIRDTLYR